MIEYFYTFRIDYMLTICCVSILFFLKTLRYKYVSDDIPVLSATKDKYKGWKKLFWQIEGSIRVNEFQDHLMTMLIHTITSVFVYIGFGCSHISFIAALLFCVNPTNNQGSVWISGRGYVLSTLFLLMAVSVPYLSPLFMYLASYFTFGYLSLIVVLFSLSPIIGVFIPLCYLLRAKRFIGNVRQKIQRESFTDDKAIHPRKLILFFKSFGYYLTLIVIPFKTTFYHSFLQSVAGNTIMQKRAYRIDLFFLVGVSSFTTFAYYICTHHNMISFALAWFIITISPFCNLYRMSQEISERYAVQASVGVMYVLSAFMGEYTPILMAIYVTKMWFYMDAYQDDYYLAETACLNSRDSWFSWHVRAMQRWGTGSFKEALTLWVMAQMISPLEFKVLWNIAVVLKIVKNEKESKEFFAKALANIPKGQEKQVEDIKKDLKEGKLPILL